VNSVLNLRVAKMLGNYVVASRVVLSPTELRGKRFVAHLCAAHDILHFGDYVRSCKLRGLIPAGSYEWALI
jgi:hypothetical protein